MSVGLYLVEKCLDLGSDGVLSLTCEFYEMPTLSTEAHDARWYKPGGEVVDTGRLFLKAIDCERVGAAVRSSYEAVKGSAVASVIGRYEWTLSQLEHVAEVMPSDAVVVDAGCVLALYKVLGEVPFLRLVDVARGQVIYETNTNSLAENWQLSQTEISRLLASGHFGDWPRIEMAGDGHVRLYLWARSILFRVDAACWTLIRISELGIDGCFAGRWLVERQGNHESRIFAAYDSRTAHEKGRFEAKEKGWIFQLAGAKEVDRVALSHEGGTIEVVDLQPWSHQALRPFPQADKRAQIRVTLSAGGKYLAAQSHEELRLVDLERGRVAAIDLPLRDEFDRLGFETRVGFFPGFLVRDDVFMTVARGVLTEYRLDSLPWQPLLRPGRRRREVGKDPLADFGLAHRRAIIDAWRKPAAALRATARRGRSEHATSFLYGNVALPSTLTWPRHDGVPMLLLCQIDLASVSKVLEPNPFPTSGTLLCFCSVDADGEIVEGEDFGTPAEVRVLYFKEAAARSRTEESERYALPAVPLKIDSDRHDYPDPDAPIVQTQHWHDEELEQYRAFLDSQRNDDESSGGHRLSGYPTLLQSNDLEYRAAMLTQTDDPTSAGSEASAAARWRLLLQFESDEFMWGTDSGILYLMIHDDDLAAADFTRVVALTQGY